MEVHTHFQLIHPAFQAVNDFCDQHHEAITPGQRNIAEQEADPKAVEEQLNNVPESTRVLLKGLTALGQLHPVIAVTVGAFALVLTMDLNRRDNDRKVLAVKVQMQELMAALFELRRISNPDDAGSDGVTIADRLKDQMETITSDIKNCGSVCDAYLKKSFLARTVKASKYETRLADYAERFVDHRRKLKLTLSIHTSLAIDRTNAHLAKQAEQLAGIERKIDHIAATKSHSLRPSDKPQPKAGKTTLVDDAPSTTRLTKSDMVSLFRKLDTPREREVHRFIDDNGGIKSVIESDQLLEQLASKSGDTSMSSNGNGSSGWGASARSNGSTAAKGSKFKAGKMDEKRKGGNASASAGHDLLELRKNLRKELAEDIDEMLERNLVLFERKLAIQSQRMHEVVKEESDRVITSLLAGAHDRITDLDLQAIWKDMGWKGSVKARHFVLALHDYYIDRVNTSPITGTSTRPKKQQDDKWALAYINAAYVQPILEAVDDDGTGFVSVKEVNTFVSERPDGWSLPHWIAFWAVGWQITISKYKMKIHALVRTFFLLLKHQHILASNRRAVDQYLFHASFWRIELLLRSTRSASHIAMEDTELVRMSDSYMKGEEERLDAALRSVQYELDTPATVSLITGAGRIERYALPLIYLLLRRHLQVMLISCHHVVDPDDFASLNDSLVSILIAVDYRIQNVEAIFKQTHSDVQSRLGNFAFGMLQLSYGDLKRIPVQSSFGTWSPEDDSQASSGSSSAPPLTTTPRSSRFSVSVSNSGLASPPPPYSPFAPQQPPLAPMEPGVTGIDAPFILVNNAIDALVTGTEASLPALKSLTSSIPLEILKHGIKDGYATTDYYEFEPHRLESEGDNSVPLQGTWTGHCQKVGDVKKTRRKSALLGDGEYSEGDGDEYGSDSDSDGVEDALDGGSSNFSSYILRLSMKVLKDGRTLAGKGEDYADTFEFKGAIKKRLKTQGGGVEFVFTVVPDETDGQSGAFKGKIRSCYGTLDTEREIITARWVSNSRKGYTIESPSNMLKSLSTVLNDPNNPNPLFELRRTPPYLVRYRYTPSQFEEDPVRSRWAFATSAATHIAQSQLWSRKFFEQRFSERKRFVELTTRSLIVSQRLTPQNPLSAVEQAELDYLRQELDPSEARFYQALAEFEIQKLPWHPSWGCDSCDRRITKARIICVECMSEDLSDNIDLCLVCIDKAPTKRGFTHAATHTVVKAEQTIHDFEFARIVDAGRRVVETTKEMLRSLEKLLPYPQVSGEGTSNSTDDEEGRPPHPQCLACEKRISAPCWACVECSEDTFICYDCDFNHRSVATSAVSEHRSSHALVRIRDNTSSQGAASTDDRLQSLEHRILTLEYKLAESQSTLSAHVSSAMSLVEEKVNKRLEIIEEKFEKRMKEMEESNEKRFDRFEALLNAIVGQTAALPALYGQVVRDYARSGPLWR